MVSVDEYTDLDRWILSKTQNLIKEANHCYKSFKVFNLMRLITKFIDDLSNWYVRRSRRRLALEGDLLWSATCVQGKHANTG